jgi:lysozyme
MRWLLSILVSSALLITAVTTARAFNCPSGPNVAREAMCSYFFYYRSETATPDARIVSRIKLSNGDRTRSIALIIGISSYPNFSSDAQLPAAANDVTRLKTFLKDDEQFDEVIVLQNAEATADNISYFLETYILSRAAQFNNKARILIAYSGHGVPSVGGFPPAVILSTATSLTDVANAYPLSRIRTSVENLANVSFHVLTLINACYGGNVFAYAFSGGNLSDSFSPGAHALTAGADNQLVYSLGGPSDGSIFFDNIIQGIKSGQADPDYPIVVVGNIKQSGGVVRLGALNNYLEKRIEELNSANPHPITPYSIPWIGPIMPAPQRALGGFFFLSRVVGEPTVGLVPSKPIVSTVAFGPTVSSVPGHPEIKIFNAPSDYPIHGIDVDHSTPIRNWETVAKANFTFAYLKATESVNRKDESFQRHWQASRAANVDHGAYHMMSFCAPIEQQFNFIKSVVPKEPDALPFALDAEYYLSEKTCAQRLGKAELQRRILQLAQDLRDYYGKVPLIYASRFAFLDFQSEQFLQYMIWLSSFGGSLAFKLPGRNPWTLWQYSDKEKIEGSPVPVEANVFFGTPDQYRDFKQGAVNVALRAVSK